MPKKGVDWRERIHRALNGLPLRGRPKGSRAGTEPGERSIPQAWRDLDEECLEFALNELIGKSLDDEQFDEQFVICAARRAHIHERQGDYKIRKLSGKLTEPRKPRTHEQRVRQLAKTVLENERRARLDEP